MASENLKVPDSRIRLNLNEVYGPGLTKPVLALLVAVTALFIAARLWKLGSYDLWGDEVFSLIAARQAWSGLFRQVINDAGQAPLFYVLLKVWIGIGGESLFWLRLLSVLLSVATLAPFFLLCRELKLHATEMTLALLLVAVNGYLIYYAQEIRPYCLLELLTVCSLWLFIKFLNSAAVNKTDLVALLAVNTLLLYTHYFGSLVIAAEFVFVFFRKRERLLTFAISAGVTALLFSPWAYAVFMRVRTRHGGVGQTVGWIPRPGWNQLVNFFTTLNGSVNFPGSSYVGLVLFGCPILLWAGHIIGRRGETKEAGQANTFWLLSLTSLLPIAIAFSVSQVFKQSVWVNRYLIICAVPYLLLVTIAFYRLRPNWLRAAAVLILCAWVGLAAFKYGNYSVRAVAWAPLVQQLIQAEPEVNGIVRVYVYQRRAPLQPLRFYLENAKEKRFRVTLVRSITEMNEDHFWVAGEESVKQPLLTELANTGYRVGEPFERGDPGKKVFLCPVWLD